MRKMLISAFTMLCCVSVFAQKTEPAHEMTQQDYLRKSKNQNTAAWILTAGGGAMIVAGVIMIGTETSYFPSEEVGTVLTIGGAAAVTTGIILFNASRKNKQKATQADIGLNVKLENAKVISGATWKNNFYPALSLTLALK